MKFHLGKACGQNFFRQFLKLNQIFRLHPHLKGHWWLITSPNIFSYIFLQIPVFHLHLERISQQRPEGGLPAKGDHNSYWFGINSLEAHNMIKKDGNFHYYHFLLSSSFDTYLFGIKSLETHNMIKKDDKVYYYYM